MVRMVEPALFVGPINFVRGEISTLVRVILHQHQAQERVFARMVSLDLRVDRATFAQQASFALQEHQILAPPLQHLYRAANQLQIVHAKEGSTRRLQLLAVENVANVR